MSAFRTTSRRNLGLFFDVSASPLMPEKSSETKSETSAPLCTPIGDINASPVGKLTWSSSPSDGSTIAASDATPVAWCPSESSGGFGRPLANISNHSPSPTKRFSVKQKDPSTSSLDPALWDSVSKLPLKERFSCSLSPKRASRTSDENSGTSFVSHAASTSAPPKRNWSMGSENRGSIRKRSRRAILSELDTNTFSDIPSPCDGDLSHLPLLKDVLPPVSVFQEEDGLSKDSGYDPSCSQESCFSTVSDPVVVSSPNSSSSSQPPLKFRTPTSRPPRVGSKRLFSDVSPSSWTGERPSPGSSSGVASSPATTLPSPTTLPFDEDNGDGFEFGPDLMDDDTQFPASSCISGLDALLNAAPTVSGSPPKMATSPPRLTATLLAPSLRTLLREQRDTPCRRPLLPSITEDDTHMEEGSPCLAPPRTVTPAHQEEPASTSSDFICRRPQNLRRCSSFTEGTTPTVGACKAISSLNLSSPSSASKSKLNRALFDIAQSTSRRPPFSSSENSSPFGVQPLVKRARLTLSQDTVTTNTFSTTAPSMPRPGLTRSTSLSLECTTRIERAMEKASLGAGSSKLIGDGSSSHSLPLHEGGSHAELSTISAETLAALVRGEHAENINSFQIVDCRYPYEFQGGHVRGAKNIYDRKDLLNLLLPQRPISPTELEKGFLGREKRNILVFHCEFSSERGPALYRFLRKSDRQLNSEHYPALYHPEIYLMHGGYKEFFSQFPELCDPREYCRMHDPLHASAMRHFRAKSKSSSALLSSARSGYFNRRGHGTGK